MGKPAATLLKKSKPTPHKPRNPDEPLPFTKESRFIIVGGGPAGVHMGHLLKSHGYNNITILEKGSEIGGKSLSFVHPPAGEDVPHEMGTCFMHAGYHRIMHLADKYGCEPYFKTGKDQYDKCNIYSPNLNKLKKIKEDEPQFIVEWMFSDIEARSTNPFCWCLPDQVQVLTVADAITRYGILHRAIFGEYEYTLPPRPDPETMKKIDMPFMSFLKLHHLTALVPILLLANSAQGYGLLETIPTFYGLWWNTPELLSCLLNKRPLTLMFQKGYQHLWRTMAQEDGLNVLLNTEVTAIDRSLGDRSRPITVKARVEGEEKTFEGDFLILSAPLKHIFQVVSDPTPDEKELFFDLKPASLITTLFKSDVINQAERSTSYFPERMNPKHQGRLQAERNSCRAIFPEREQDPNQRFSVAYQYYEDFDPNRGEEAANMLKKDLAEVGYQKVEIVKQCNWEYFNRFNFEQIKKGLPWKVLDVQGTQRTWYIGSSACFESVEDVTSYNHLILKIFNMEEFHESKEKREAKEKEMEERWRRLKVLDKVQENEKIEG